MTLGISGALTTSLGVSAVWLALFGALGLWATLIYFFNYFHIRAMRREVEAIKDALEVQVRLTEKLVAAVAPAQPPAQQPPAPPAQ